MNSNASHILPIKQHPEIIIIEKEVLSVGFSSYFWCAFHSLLLCSLENFNFFHNLQVGKNVLKFATLLRKGDTQLHQLQMFSIIHTVHCNCSYMQIYIYQQMHIKCVKLEVIYIHNLSYMFCQIFTIFREIITQRSNWVLQSIVYNKWPYGL